MRRYTQEYIRRQLAGMVEECGTYAKAAAKIGVSVPYLFEIVKGTRQPGPKILDYFDLEKTVEVSYVTRRENTV